MRGDDPQQTAIFSDMSPEERVPQDHPLRAIRALVNAVLKELSAQFDMLDSDTGRPTIALEKWLRALAWHVLDTVRRERRLMEQLNDYLLVRWCVCLHIDDSLWDPSTVSKNRERWLERDVAHAFFEQVLAQVREGDLRSDAHCTVDGTLIEAWAGQQRCTRKESTRPSSSPDDLGNPSLDCRGERRTNAPHASTTDPETRLYKKATGQEAQLGYLGHGLREHRHGLVVDTRVTQATGTAAREAALAMAEGIHGLQRVTWGADKHDDTRDFARELRKLQVAPHTTGRSSAFERRTPRHSGDAVSQRKRTCVEEIFGWMTTVGLRCKTRHRGAAQVGWRFPFAAAVFNLVRMRTLAAVVCAPRKAGAGGPGHRFTSLPRPKLGTQNLVMFQRSSHRISGRLAGTTVNLLNGIFQQPARYGLASIFGFGRDINGHFAEWIGQTC